MEHNHGGLVQIIFLSKWLISRFHVNLPGCNLYDPVIFGLVCHIYAEKDMLTIEFDRFLACLEVAEAEAEVVDGWFVELVLTIFF